MMPDEARRRFHLPVILVALAAFLAQAAAADELKPFEISYTWSYHGMTVAVSTLKLEQRDAQTWVYSSSSEPRGIGHLFPQRPRMQSVMRITADGVQPLSYHATAGTSSTARDINVSFDWEHNRVTGVYENTKVDMPLPPGTQDDLSVQIALMVDLLRGQVPSTFLLLEKNGARKHFYTREGTETLSTKIGSVPTVIYRSVAEYSPRATRFWCAPDRGFIPMKVQQKKGDSIEWTMLLQSFKRD